MSFTTTKGMNVSPTSANSGGSWTAHLNPTLAAAKEEVKKMNTLGPAASSSRLHPPPIRSNAAARTVQVASMAAAQKRATQAAQLSGTSGTLAPLLRTSASSPALLQPLQQPPLSPTKGVSPPPTLLQKQPTVVRHQSVVKIVTRAQDADEDEENYEDDTISESVASLATIVPAGQSSNVAASSPTKAPLVLSTSPPKSPPSILVSPNAAAVATSSPFTPSASPTPSSSSSAGGGVASPMGGRPFNPNRVTRTEGKVSTNTAKTLALAMMESPQAALAAVRPYLFRSSYITPRKSYGPHSSSSSSADKTIDMILLSNDDCAPLALQLQQSLSEMQYTVEVHDEVELASHLSTAEAQRFPLVLNAHKVVWIMTNNMWNFPGCVSMASIAHSRDVEVILVRHEGAQWEVEAGVFATVPNPEKIVSYGVEHLFATANAIVDHESAGDAYEHVFLPTMAKLLGEPQVIAATYVKSSNSLKDNIEGLATILSQCDDAEELVEMASFRIATLVLQQFCRIYGLSSSWTAASSTSPLSVDDLRTILHELIDSYWQRFEMAGDVEQMHQAIVTYADASASSEITTPKMPLVPANLQSAAVGFLWCLFIIIRGLSKINDPTAVETLSTLFYTPDVTRRLVRLLYFCRNSSDIVSICTVLLLFQFSHGGSSQVHANQTAMLVAFKELRGHLLMQQLLLSHPDDVNMSLHGVLLGRCLVRGNVLGFPIEDSLQLASAIAYPILAQFPHDVALQREGWRLWSAQSQEQQMQALKKIDQLSSGCLRHLVSTLQQHASDVGIVDFTIQLLKHCVNDDTLSRAALSYGVIDALLTCVAQSSTTDATLFADVLNLMDAFVAKWGLDPVVWFVHLSPHATTALKALGASKSAQQLSSRLNKCTQDEAERAKVEAKAKAVLEGTRNPSSPSPSDSSSYQQA